MLDLYICCSFRWRLAATIDDRGLLPRSINMRGSPRVKKILGEIFCFILGLAFFLLKARDFIRNIILNRKSEDEVDSFNDLLIEGNELCRGRIRPMSPLHINQVKYVYKTTHRMLKTFDDDDEQTPLTEAASGGLADLVWGFIEYSKQTNTDLHTDNYGKPKEFLWHKNKAGLTALHVAMNKNHVEVIKVLLSNAEKSDLESEWDSIGKDSLLPLLRDPAYDDLIFDMLRKENVKPRTSTPSTPIDIQQLDVIDQAESIKDLNLQTWSERNEPRKYFDELDGLLGSNPNTSTILHLRSKSGEANHVKDILEKDHSLIYCRNSEGETPAFVAAREGHVYILNIMINIFKRLNKDNESLVALFTRLKDKHNSLHIAILNHRVEVIFWLVKEIPQLANHINDFSESPIYLAAERRYFEIIKYISINCERYALDGPHGKSAVHASAISNSEGCIYYTLDAKGDLLKYKDERGWTPLRYAIHHGSSEVTYLMLDIDHSIGYEVMTQDGIITTAIHIAASRGHCAAMEVLINKCQGCSEFIDEKGRNILHVAIESMQTEVIEFIFQNTSLTSLINQRDNNGNTPVHLLVTSNYEMLEMVIDSRVDINTKNNENRTPLDMIDSDEKKERLIKAIAMRTIIPNKRGSLFPNISKSDSYEMKPEAKDKKLDEDFKMVDNLVLVATLIATATFAAGFTMPGGFDSDDGSKQGTPYLLRKSAFQAFVVTNAIAFSCSCSVLLAHIALLIYRNRYDEIHWGQQQYIDRRIIVMYFLTGIALVTMVLAFVTGLYVVLTPSLWLAIFICVMSLFIVGISLKL